MVIQQSATKHIALFTPFTAPLLHRHQYTLLFQRQIGDGALIDPLFVMQNHVGCCEAGEARTHRYKLDANARESGRCSNVCFHTKFINYS